MKKKEEGRVHKHIIKIVMSLSVHPPTQPRRPPECLMPRKMKKKNEAEQTVIKEKKKNRAQ